MPTPKIHKSITQERVEKLYREALFGTQDFGICIACGEETCSNVEPDASNYECETCGKKEVFGAENLIYMVL